MNIIKNTFIAGAIVALALVPVVASTDAAVAQQPQNCEINAEYPSKDRNFMVDGKTITGKIKVEGDAGCTQDVTLSVFDTVKYGAEPLDEQVLYDYTTITGLGVGVHRITANLPVCEENPEVITFYQADLFRGTEPAAPNGLPVSDAHNFPGDRLMDWKYGGQECPEPVVITETEIVTEEVVQEVPVQTPPQVKSLPNTGPAAVAAGIMGTGALAGFSHAWLRSKKAIKNSFKR